MTAAGHGSAEVAHRILFIITHAGAMGTLCFPTYILRYTFFVYKHTAMRNAHRQHA
jgi:hypothetical protein